MKKTVSIILALIMMLSVFTVVSADEKPITVKLNDEVLMFDVNPIIENDRTLVPFRAIFESLGCAVLYYPTERGTFVLARKADDSVILEIGKTEMIVSDKTVELDVPAKIVDDRTLVPLRAISEALGADVAWDGETRTVSITTETGDYKVTSKTVSSEIKAEDGRKILDLVAVYPVLENPENDEFITLINDLSEEFCAGFLYADDELEARANAIYKELGDENMPFPMELSVTYTVDLNKDGILSVTFHTVTDYISSYRAGKESIVYDMKNKKQLELTDILNGDLDTEINQTVYDAFRMYYEQNFADTFDAATAEKLGSELSNVRYTLVENGLVMYFNPGQVIDEYPYAQTVLVPYSESMFKLELTQPKDIILPFGPYEATTDVLDATLSVSLKEGGAYVDDSGAMVMDVEVYTYDLYDMVDIALLEAGDSIVRLGEVVEVKSVERTEGGLVSINGGEENGGFDLISNDSTVYHEIGFNDVKKYYSLGKLTVKVSPDFVYVDKSDIEAEEKTYYPGDFLTDEAGIKYDFIPENTTLRVENGVAVEMVKSYTP